MRSIASGAIFIIEGVLVPPFLAAQNLTQPLTIVLCFARRQNGSPVDGDPRYGYSHDWHTGMFASPCADPLCYCGSLLCLPVRRPSSFPFLTAPHPASLLNSTVLLPSLLLGAVVVAAAFSLLFPPLVSLQCIPLPPLLPSLLLPRALSLRLRGQGANTEEQKS